MNRILTIVVVAAMCMLATVAYAKENPMIAMETSEGKIVVELYPDKAPITVQNFLWYVDNGFYDGLIFHRVIDGFMIQGGGFTPDMKQKASSAPPIENEAYNGLSNDKYTIAMARTNVVNSATSQFFINVKDNTALNHTAKTDQGFGYCVFGKVVSGTDAVDAIKGMPTGNQNGMADVPKTPVLIKTAYRCDAEGKMVEKEKKEKAKD